MKFFEERFSQIKNLFKELEDEYLVQKGRKDQILEDVGLLEDKQKNNLQDSEILEKVVLLLQSVADVKREEIKIKIENLVTQALQSVFEDGSYKFKINLVILRDNISAQLKIVSVLDDMSIETEIMKGRGGGIVDVVSFVLQVITLVMYKPQKRQVLIADEPFKHVSRKYLENISELLKWLHEITKIQFIIVTHKSELTDNAHKVFETSMNSKKVTKIKELVK